MAKPSAKKKKNAPTYSSDLLMIRVLLGILIIGFGLLSLISIIAPMEGVVFTFVQSLTYGLAEIGRAHV